MSKVDKINKVPGCDLIPLPSVLTKDKKHVMNILNHLRIPNDADHRFIYTDEGKDVTLPDINKSLVKILKKARELTSQGKILQLFVYYGGHGAGFEQQ